METPILDALIKMMEKVADHNLNLFMLNMFEDVSAISQNKYENGEVNIHNCGTACCIMGYASLDKEVLKLAEIDTRNEYPNEIASKVWSKLSAEIGDKFSDSIAGSTARIRLFRVKCALKEVCLPSDWVQDYSHVSGPGNTEDPTEAVLYMKKLREVLQTTVE